MDQTFFQSSTERTSSVASGDGSPTNFYFDDLMFNNSDMGLVATLVPPALLTQPLQQMLEQQFAASSLDMSRELQRQQQQHQMQQWMYDKSRQQQSSITLQPPEQHQENVVCAPQLHQHPSTMTTLHDEHSSRTPSPTIHVLDSLQLAPPTTQPLQSLPQYVFQEVTSSLVSMDHWRHRSSPQESPTTPDSIWAVTDSYFPSNLAPEARSLSPTVGFTSVEDLCLSRLDVSGSTTATTTHAGYECTIATGQQYMQTSATTSSYQESQQLDPFTDSESEESIMPAKKKRVRRLSRGTSGRSQTPQVKLKVHMQDRN
ncbi:hypothetical protein BGX31_011177 [Mortierella sp. GBA43]|nr:hypothetical protein BGX31_011177 [Mortierella sp. GBA43]